MEARWGEIETGSACSWRPSPHGRALESRTCGSDLWSRDFFKPSQRKMSSPLVPPAGFEPAHPAPEAGALSPELRGRAKSAYAGACRLTPGVQAP